MLVYSTLFPLHRCCRVPVWVGWGGWWWWWWWWCKVIIVSNPTAIEVSLSCIEVGVGVLTIFPTEQNTWLYKITINVVGGRCALKHTGADTGRKLWYRAYSRHSARCVLAPPARPGASSSSSRAGLATSHTLSLASWRKNSTLSDACGLEYEWLVEMLKDKQC